MDFTKLITERISTTYFEPGFKISDTDFLEILETVRFTPSGYNAQPWEFLLIRDPERLKKLYEIGMNQQKILDAGNLVVVLGNKAFGRTESERILDDWKTHRHLGENKLQGLKSSLEKKREDHKEREMVIRNTSLAAMNFLLSAENLGFATSPMMGFKQLKLRKFLELPDEILPVLMIALGKKDT